MRSRLFQEIVSTQEATMRQEFSIRRLKTGQFSSQRLTIEPIAPIDERADGPHGLFVDGEETIAPLSTNCRYRSSTPSMSVREIIVISEFTRWLLGHALTERDSEPVTG
jgi:hypothetical protein